MKRPLVRALQGIVLSTGAPLGWLALRTLAGAEAWHEMLDAPGIYLYLLFGTALAFAGFGIYVGRQEEEYLENSLHDELTGLHNTRYFRRRLVEELAFEVRHQRPLALLIADIDFFKRVNDEHGHHAGDQVLVGIAKTFMSLRRRGDTIARIGGEEFAVILPETDLAEAVQVADRLRKAIADQRFEFPRGTVSVTISLGAVVSLPAHPVSAAELFRSGDAAMYRAKRAGRNRVATGALSAQTLVPSATGTA